MDESNDVDTSQLLIFIRGIYATFAINEELGCFCCLKCAPTGEDLFLKVQEALASVELSWEKLEKGNSRGWKKQVILRPR